MAEGTWVGLDVHARKTVAGVLDAQSGELRSLRAPTLPGEMVEWLLGLPAPVRVAYEAGPTGYGLARACAVAGIACTVAAPSKIQRAPADRVKTDRRDAERLARLLRLGKLVAVRVPEPHEEAARDLVRAREDARGELMRARHRLSKLLLRHVWSTTHRRGRSPTTPGCDGSGSTRGRCSSRSRSRMRLPSRRRRAAICSTRRSSNWPVSRRSPRRSAASAVYAAFRR